MTAPLFLVIVSAVLVAIAVRVRPDPDPDPANVVHLAWIRSLKHDADLDQAVEIGNYDRFKEWEREVAA